MFIPSLTVIRSNSTIKTNYLVWWRTCLRHHWIFSCKWDKYMYCYTQACIAHLGFCKPAVPHQCWEDCWARLQLPRGVAWRWQMCVRVCLLCQPVTFPIPLTGCNVCNCQHVCPCVHVCVHVGPLDQLMSTGERENIEWMWAGWIDRSAETGIKSIVAMRAINNIQYRLTINVLVVIRQ